MTPVPRSGSTQKKCGSKSLVAAVTAALVAAWLLGSSSMHRKFNSDHFTFLKYENPSRGSGVMTYAMTALTRCAQTDRQTDTKTHTHTDLAVELTSPFGRGQLKRTRGL